jgi:hypothetical protein
MNVKRMLAGILGVMVVSWVCAQEAPPPVMPSAQDALALARGQIQADRQMVVAANLGLTEAEGKAFWPLYREYRAEMEKFGDRISDIILEYAKNFDTMTDAQAKALIKEYLAIQTEEAATKQAWIRKFEKALPSKKVARFYQIDNKLDLLVRLAVAKDVPLVE